MEVEPRSWCLRVIFFFSIVQFCKCHRVQAVGAFDHLVWQLGGHLNTILSLRENSKCQMSGRLLGGRGVRCRRSGVSQWVIQKPNNLNKTNVINIVFMQTSEVIYQHRWTNSQHHHNFNCGNKQSFLSNRMVTKDKSRNSNIHRLNSFYGIIIKPGQDGLLRMHMAD